MLNAFSDGMLTATARFRAECRKKGVSRNESVLYIYHVHNETQIVRVLLVDPCALRGAAENRRAEFC